LVNGSGGFNVGQEFVEFQKLSVDLGGGGLGSSNLLMSSIVQSQNKGKRERDEKFQHF
jgi:hypothetical protein